MEQIPPDADLSKIPLAMPPNGTQPNFMNPQTNSATMFGVGIPLAIISAFFVVLRLATNFRMVRKLCLDDWLCLAAWLLMTVYMGLCLSFENTSRHAYDVPLSYLDADFAKRSFAVNLVVGPALWCSKAAILALYTRVFEPKRWLVYTANITMGIIFLFYFAQVPISCAFCAPKPGKAWDIYVVLSCGRTSFMGPVQGAIGMFADLFIIALPIPIIRGLNLPFQKKLGLAIVFLLGCFALLASIVSLYYRTVNYLGDDVFWNTANIYATVFAEAYVTIMVACAPATSSFWVNTFTKTTFYSSIRSGHLFSQSRHLFSWATRSSTKVESGVTMSKTPLPAPPTSMTDLVQESKQSYHNLYETPYIRREASSGGGSSSTECGTDGFIRKSTTIDQVSEKRE